MLQAALLWFKFNPHDPCMKNPKKKGSQHTITFHVDDLKSSHKNPKVNNKFERWLQTKQSEHGKVKARRGKKHDCSGMMLGCSKKGKSQNWHVRPCGRHTEEVSNEAQQQRHGINAYNGQSKKLNKERSKALHTVVAKGLFASKRARPDTQPTVALLCARVKDPKKSDWKKLIRLMKCLNSTKGKKLTLSADDIWLVKWFVDASFAVRAGFKSHAGATMTLGKGAAQSISANFF